MSLKEKNTKRHKSNKLNLVYMALDQQKLQFYHLLLKLDQNICQVFPKAFDFCIVTIHNKQQQISYFAKFSFW